MFFITCFFIFYYTIKIYRLYYYKSNYDIEIDSDVYYLKLDSRFCLFKLFFYTIPKCAGFVIAYIFMRRLLVGTPLNRSYRSVYHNLLFSYLLNINSFNLLVSIKLSDDLYDLFYLKRTRKSFLFVNIIINNFTFHFNKFIEASKKMRIYIENSDSIVFNTNGSRVILYDACASNEKQITTWVKPYKFLKHPGLAVDNTSSVDTSVQFTGFAPYNTRYFKVLVKNYNKDYSCSIYNVYRHINNTSTYDRYNLVRNFGINNDEKILSFKKIIHLHRLAYHGSILYEGSCFSNNAVYIGNYYNNILHNTRFTLTTFESDLFESYISRLNYLSVGEKSLLYSYYGSDIIKSYNFYSYDSGALLTEYDRFLHNDFLRDITLEGVVK